MNNLDFVTLVLPAHWAVPLINDDDTGLEDEDQRAIAEWCQDHPNLSAVGISEDTFFRHYHDASQYALACDCVEFTFQVFK